MKIPFKPLPAGEPRLDTKQFLARLKSDPGFASKMQAHYESMLALPANADTADMHKQAAGALRMLKHHQGIWLGNAALIRAKEVMEQAKDIRSPETLQQLSDLANEATDHFLDAVEPDRTTVMARATKIREMIAKLAEKH